MPSSIVLIPGKARLGQRLADEDVLWRYLDAAKFLDYMHNRTLFFCRGDRFEAKFEGFFGRLKIEMFFQRDWLSTTINEFVAALDAYIRWYNEARIKISLGGLSPAGHRRSLGIAA